MGGGERRGAGEGWTWEGVRAASGPVARPGVNGGEKASDRSHGESASVDDTLDNRLERILKFCILSSSLCITTYILEPG